MSVLVSMRIYWNTNLENQEMLLAFVVFEKTFWYLQCTCLSDDCIRARKLYTILRFTLWSKTSSSQYANQLIAQNCGCEAVVRSHRPAWYPVMHCCLHVNKFFQYIWVISFTLTSTDSGERIHSVRGHGACRKHVWRGITSFI